MIVRFINRLNFNKQIGHYIGACGIIGRYRHGIVGVNGALLQTYGIELYRSKSKEYRSLSSAAGQSSYSALRIALSTGVVLMLGSAGE